MTISDYLALPESAGAVHVFRAESHPVTYVYVWDKSAGTLASRVAHVYLRTGVTS